MDFLIEPWLAKRTVNILVGRPSVGKTHLVIQLAEYFRKQLEPIVMVATDRSIEHAEEVFKKLSITPFQLLSKIDEDAADWKNVRKRLGIESHLEHFGWLEKRIEAMPKKPKLLILDPGQLYVPCKDLLGMSSAAHGFTGFGAWIKNHDMTVLLTWHSNKTNPELLNDPFDSISGSTTVQGYSCTKMLLEPPKKSRETYLLTVRGQHFPDQFLELTRSSQDGSFQLISAKNEIPEQRYDIKCNEILRFIPPVGQQGIKAVDIADLSGKSKATVYRYLTTLEKAQQVHCDHDGFWVQLVPLIN